MQPRNVHLTFRHRKNRPESQIFLRSSTPIPVVLHLNRDARAEGLKIYQLLFGDRKYPPEVYFSPELDTLYFGPVNRFGIVEDDPRKQKWLSHELSEGSTSKKFFLLSLI
jgi:hypothetical protein